MYKLFYYPRNASWAPHLILKELGVYFDLELVDRKLEEQRSRDYLQLNPTGRIPTLIDGSEVIFESAAIALHLCDKHPEGNLLPRLNTRERTMCYQWLFYLTSTLQSELMVYFYPAKHTIDSSYTPDIVEAQETRIINMFTILDEQIGSRNYLVGSEITICDYFLFMLCHWRSGLKRSPLTYSNLSRCLKGLASRESFKEVCAFEGTSLQIYQ